MPGHRKSAADRKREIVDTTLHLLANLPVETLTTERIAKEVRGLASSDFPSFPDQERPLARGSGDCRGPCGKGVGNRPSNGRLSHWTGCRAVLEAQLGLIAVTPAVPKLIFGAGHPSHRVRNSTGSAADHGTAARHIAA